MTTEEQWMRNIKEEAEKLLGESEALLPDDIKVAAAAYASRHRYAWWESAFLIDELEKLTGVVLHSPRAQTRIV